MKLNTNLKIIAGFFVILIIIGFTYFFLAIYSPNAGLYVVAYETNESPANYLELSMEELNNYPDVKNAVMQPNEEIKATGNAVNFSEILYENNTSHIKINGTYYRVRVTYAD
ncbi:MAG: hypothetical protein SCH66_03640 [Methanolobus sp.]|nr:hypothetical protein [Methanolobus sp.]